MIKLYGFPVSNYYQMAYFSLLEKGLDFEVVEAISERNRWVHREARQCE